LFQLFNRPANIWQACSAFEHTLMSMTLSFLIIGSPGRLRDALRTFLYTLAPTTEIETADDFESGYAAAAKKQPSVVIIDGRELLDSDCRLLKQLLSRRKSSRCLIIADTLQRASRARQAGADGVILQGFTIQTLHQTLQSLIALPHDGDNGYLPAPLKPMKASAPLQQEL
jgi:DNA-binding NarL/FixJ family response regulator